MSHIDDSHKWQLIFFHFCIVFSYIVLLYNAVFKRTSQTTETDTYYALLFFYLQLLLKGQMNTHNDLASK